MVRGGFTGSRSSGGGGIGTFGNIGAKKDGKSAKEMFLAKMRGESEENLTNDERYKLMFEKKMENMRKEAQKGANGREMSKSTLAVIEQLAMKKAKKDAKLRKKRRQVKINATSFGGMTGGRIDGKGQIFGPDGVLLAKVTAGGLVKPVGGFGGTICKYDGSGFSEYKIARYVEKVHTQKQAKLESAGVGSFWGGGSSDDSGGWNGNGW